MAKKDKSEKPDHLDLQGLSIEAIVAKINAKFGLNTLVQATHAKGAVQSWTSTSCDAFDLITGGGIPRNRITELRGPFSSLKSTLSYCAIRNFLADDPEGVAILVDAEHSYDGDYARRIVGSVNFKRLCIVNPDSGEQAVDVVNDLMGTGRAAFFVVDSIAAMVPTAELVASMDQATMAAQARLINRMMRIVVARMKRSMYLTSAPTTTVLCLNQLRDRTGVVYGNPEMAPGGKGKEFAYSLIVRVSSTPSCKIVEPIERNGIKRNVTMGQTVNFSIIKNKCFGTQYEDGEFTFYRRNYKGYAPLTFDNDVVLLRYGIFFGLIKVTKGRYSYPRLSKSYGKESLIQEALRDSPEVALQLREEILEKLREESHSEDDLSSEETVEVCGEEVVESPKKVVFKKK